MLTEKQLKEIREHLEKAQNPVFFFDNDADGLIDTEDSDEYGSSREAALRIVADHIINRIIEELISTW